MTGYDPQRTRMRARPQPSDPGSEAAEMSPVDALLGSVPAASAPEPAAVDPVTPAPDEHVHEPAPAHEHGPDCDHDHGGIDVRVIAAAVAAAAAATVTVLVRRRRGRTA